MRCAPLIAVTVLSLRAPSLAAQAPTSLAEVQPGARIRVEAPGIVAGRYVGTVLTRTGDTVTLGNPSRVPIALPLGRAESVEISRGKSRSAGALRGVQWGGAIGLGLGLFTVAFSERCANCEDQLSDAEGITVITLSSALWGAGIGALVGRERWERFELRERTSLHLDAGSRTVMISLRR